MEIHVAMYILDIGKSSFVGSRITIHIAVNRIELGEE